MQTVRAQDMPVDRVGAHLQVKWLGQKDINSRFMLMCQDCGTCAHAYTQEDAVADLSRSSCSPGCVNCQSLRHSFDCKPAVPIYGSCNDKLHVCPNDGNRWWQTNGHFHLWQQVTSDREWEALQNEQTRNLPEESGFGIGW